MPDWIFQMECIAELPFSQPQIGRRPKKRPRIGYDGPQPPKAQIGLLCGQEVGGMISLVSSVAMFDPTSSLFTKGVARNASPPWREDNKDGHYMFAVGENLTSRYKIYSKMGEGTFGQVLECWDRERKEMVAIKIVLSIKKYREAAMLEIEVLQYLAKYDRSNCCVQIRNWFDYSNHICIVFEKLGLSLYDFLRKNGYQPFPIDLVREIGRQLLESVARVMHDLQLIHTDLKPENILVVSSDYIKVSENRVSAGTISKRLPKSSAIKLIDFGSATYEHQDHNYIVSTRHYRAPEVILGMEWGYPCDILGAFLWNYARGKLYFGHMKTWNTWP